MLPFWSYSGHYFLVEYYLFNKQVGSSWGWFWFNACGLWIKVLFAFQQPTLSDMTMYEMNFSLLVEDMLQNIDQPQYRQIIVEVCGQ